MARPVWLTIAAAACGLFFSNNAFANWYFKAELEGAQEVPPTVSTATGMGRVMLSDSRDQIRISLHFTGLGSNQTMAHIHGPAAPGSNAGILFNIGSSGTTSGTFNLTAAVTPAQVADLERGLWYFNVHSVDLTAGEIRGQIWPDAPFEAVLTGSQEVPPVLSGAIGRSVLSLNESETLIAVDVRYTGLGSATSAGHIHGPAAVGANAGILFDLGLSGGTSGQAGDLFFPVSPAQVADLRAGLHYVNIHSATFTGGEIRGQYFHTLRSTSFVAPLTGSQEVPPNASTATGLAVVDVLPGDGVMLVSVYWQGIPSAINAGHIHGNAPVGVNAGIVFDLGVSGGGSGQVINQSFPITPAQLAMLRAGRWYVNLHSTDFTGGEIRGQLFPNWPYRAFMTGDQETPANASTGYGLGQVLLTPNAGEIVQAYLFSGLVAPASAGHIHQGAVGVAGPVVFNTPPPAATFGSVPHLRFAVTPAQASALHGGLLYYNVHNATFPGGEIRGQLYAHDRVYVGGFD